MFQHLKSIISQWSEGDKVMGVIGTVGGYLAGIFFMDISTLASAAFHFAAVLIGAGFTGMAGVFGKHFAEKIIFKFKTISNGKEKRRNKKAA